VWLTVDVHIAFAHLKIPTFYSTSSYTVVLCQFYIIGKVKHNTSIFHQLHLVEALQCLVTWSLTPLNDRLPRITLAMCTCAPHLTFVMPVCSQIVCPMAFRHVTWPLPFHLKTGPQITSDKGNPLVNFGFRSFYTETEQIDDSMQSVMQTCWTT